jgi:uncharacterized phage protein gp47/JayE
MAYQAPTITSAGLTIPTYTDILEELINEAKSIYGQDIYLGIDSQDYQFLSIFASKTFDVMQLLQLVYNNRAPSTAIGSALDSIVKLNGVTRKSGVNSTCDVLITGTALTQISNGVVEDITGYQWSLPAVVIIGESGSIITTATCQVKGAIAANPGDINVIVTPTYGWASVTNTDSAILGRLTETDSEVRSRQAVSVSLTSSAVLDALRSAIANIESVIRYKVYENDTNEIDDNGLVAHSIAAVVDGGSDDDIASAIFNKKAPGVYTQGDILVDVTDSDGQINIIRFYRPSPVDIDVVVNVKKLTGYTDQTTMDIKKNIVTLLNSLTIGDDVSISSLWGAALSAMGSLSNPTFSITALTAAIHSEAQGSSDIVIAFDEAVRSNISYITVNVT